MWNYCVHIKTATVRDLRNDFGKLETWLAEGEEISIEKRGKPVAVLSPPKMTFVKPDYRPRLNVSGVTGFSVKKR